MGARSLSSTTGASLRASLAARLAAARERTDALLGLLTPQGLYERPVAERHRFIFYLGHLEAFDLNLLTEAAGDDALARLFAFGIDPVGADLPRDEPADWPAVEQIRRWISAARAKVDAAIARRPLTGALEAGWACHLAIEHRQMHAETLCYLLRRLDVGFKVPGRPPTELAAPCPPQSWVQVPAGDATLGLSRAAAPHLGWDNEYEAHRVGVDAFEVSRYPITNRDWLAFMEAGGYSERSWWADADWGWRERDGVTHPACWRKRDGAWWQVAMFGEVPLPEAWPSYVSHAEASAYARFMGARLLTEAQWHRAALGAPEGERDYPWGAEAPLPRVHGNFGFARFDPSPVGALPRGASAFGVDELTGNGWEWTATPFAPFEGFEALPFYPGYSANFFEGRHFVLKGAAPVTDLAFLRRSYRNWFQPHYPHVFAKFRLVKGASE